MKHRLSVYHCLNVSSHLACQVFISCPGIKWRIWAILRLEVIFDEGSEVFYRGIKPRVFLVFEICFFD